MARESVSFLRVIQGHIEVEWEIKNFLDLPYQHHEDLYSESFWFSDANWYFLIYPNGRDGLGWMSLFLCSEDVSVKHRVLYSLGIKANGTLIRSIKEEATLKENFDPWGDYKFVKRSVLSDILNEEPSDNVLTIMCSIRLLDGLQKEVATQVSQPDCIQNLSKDLEELFVGGYQTNVKLRVQKREFEAHKSILMVRSPVFRAMFENEMVEKNSGIVEIPDLDPEIFQDFLFFLYTGKLDKVTSVNAVGLYKAADKYLLNDLKTECALRMASGLFVETILDVLHLASTHEESELLNVATEYFLNNSVEVFKTEKWKIFFVENSGLANDLLIKLGTSYNTERRN